MRKSSSPRISDGLRLLDELSGRDTRLKSAIAEARLALEIAQAAHAAREASGMSAEELDLHAGLRPETVAHLEHAGSCPHAFAQLVRIAESLDLGLRIVLVPGPPRGKRAPVANIARLR